MSDEHSQPHVVVPLSKEGGDITLNAKTILLALALFAGGGIGGGGLSIFARGSTDIVTKQSFDDLKVQVTQIQAQLVDLNKTMLSMEGDLKNDAEIHKRQDEQLADHETRLRSLERAHH